MSEEITNLNEEAPKVEEVKEATELNLEQRQKLVDFWNSHSSDNKEPPSLKSMVEVNFPGYDARSKFGMMTKRALAELKLKATPSQQYIKKRVTPQAPELSEDQKTFIKNHLEMPSVELARELFNKPEIMPTDPEVRLIQGFLKSLEGFVNVNKETLEIWKPPRNFSETLARINKYVHVRTELDKLTPQQKKNVEMTLSLLNDHRFTYTVNSYVSSDDRELFESSYIKYIYNKSEITAEDLDLIINLASDIVTIAKAERQVCQLEDLFISAAQGSDGTRASKSIGDHIASLKNEIGDAKTRQEKVSKVLQGSRSERLKNKIAENASMVALISAWRSKLHRDRLVKYAQLKDDAVKQELNKLESMEAIKISIFGISKDEIASYEEDNKEAEEIKNTIE